MQALWYGTEVSNQRLIHQAEGTWFAEVGYSRPRKAAAPPPLPHSCTEAMHARRQQKSNCEYCGTGAGLGLRWQQHRLPAPQ